MSDYISREAVKQIIAAQCGECADACLEFDGIQPDCNQCLLNGAKKAIESIPAADVRPVVRGKWSIHEIYKHEMSYGVTAYEPVYKCSACGSLMESYLRFDEPIMPEDADFPRFCPNCGADMREANDEKA